MSGVVSTFHGLHFCSPIVQLVIGLDIVVHSSGLLKIIVTFMSMREDNRRQFQRGSIMFLIMVSLSYAFSAQSQIPSFGWALQIPSRVHGPHFKLRTCVDPLSNVYITHPFSSRADFDPTSGEFFLEPICRGNSICKYDASGKLIWAKMIDHYCTTSLYGEEIAVSAKGEVYLFGTFQGTVDFDPGPGTYTVDSETKGNTFVVKFDPLGNFSWVKLWQYIDIQGFAVSNQGEVYVPGTFATTVDLDPGPNTKTVTPNVCVLKLDAQGNLVWTYVVGGPSGEYLRLVCLDSQENVVIQGYQMDHIDFDPGPGISYIDPSQGQILIKLDKNGNYRSGSGLIFPSRRIKMDNKGNFISAGEYNGVKYFPNNDTLRSYGYNDIFISKYGTDGKLLWVHGFGGPGFDEVGDITVDSANSVFIGGTFIGLADFNPGSAVDTMRTLAGHEGFIVKYDSSGQFQWARKTNGKDYKTHTEITAVHCVQNGGLLTTGMFENGEVDFDFTSSSSIFVPYSTDADVFFMKYDNATLVAVNETRIITNGISCYPNPSNGVVTLQLDEKLNSDIAGFKLWLFNSIGVLVDYQFDRKDLRYDLSSFPNGIYTLIIDQAQNKRGKTRIIKN
jgi:hypothetical protein